MYRDNGCKGRRQGCDQREGNKGQGGGSSRRGLCRQGKSRATQIKVKGMARRKSVVTLLGVALARHMDRCS